MPVTADETSHIECTSVLTYKLVNKFSLRTETKNKKNPSFK